MEINEQGLVVAVAVSLGSNDLSLFRSLRFARLGDVGKYAHISCNGAEDSDTRAWLRWFTKLKNNHFRKPGPERYYPACDLMVWGVAVCSYPFCTNINWPEWKNYCRVVWAQRKFNWCVCVCVFSVCGMWFWSLSFWQRGALFENRQMVHIYFHYPKLWYGRYRVGMCRGDRDGGGNAFTLRQINIFREPLSGSGPTTAWLESACPVSPQESWCILYDFADQVLW